MKRRLINSIGPVAVFLVFIGLWYLVAYSLQNNFSPASGKPMIIPPPHRLFEHTNGDYRTHAFCSHRHHDWHSHGSSQMDRALALATPDCPSSHPNHRHRAIDDSADWCKFHCASDRYGHHLDFPHRVQHLVRNTVSTSVTP